MKHAKKSVIFIILGLFLVSSVFAVCPFCTFAVGAGIGLTQFFGIDDTITGLWVGGFIVSLVIATYKYMEKKNLQFYGYKPIIIISYYLIILAPLYLTNLIGHDLNKWHGIDKIILGVSLGSLSFFLGAISYEYLKKKNNNKAYFPFQKVVMPIAPLIILSVVFYILT